MKTRICISRHLAVGWRLRKCKSEIYFHVSILRSTTILSGRKKVSFRRGSVDAVLLFVVSHVAVVLVVVVTARWSASTHACVRVFPFSSYRCVVVVVGSEFVSAAGSRVAIDRGSGDIACLRSV